MTRCVEKLVHTDSSCQLLYLHITKSRVQSLISGVDNYRLQVVWFADLSQACYYYKWKQKEADKRNLI